MSQSFELRWRENLATGSMFELLRTERVHHTGERFECVTPFLRNERKALQGNQNRPDDLVLSTHVGNRGCSGRFSTGGSRFRMGVDVLVDLFECKRVACHT